MRKIEERDKHGHVTGHRWEASHSWRKVVDEENYVDFYLQDGTIKLFVQGSQRDHCKIQSTWDEAGRAYSSFYYNDLPRSIEWLVHTYSPSFGGWSREWWRHGHHHDGPTGQFRWSECIYEVNEKIAALGVASASNPDPYTQTTTLSLIPFDKQAMNPNATHVQENWSVWDIWSWSDLLDHGDAVMLSDSDEFTGGVEVQPALDLPRWQQQYTPTYAVWETPTDQWNQYAPTAPPMPPAAQPHPAAQNPGYHPSAPPGQNHVAQA